MQLIELFVDSKIMEHQDLEKTPHDKVCPHDLGRGDAERSECSPFRFMYSIAPLHCKSTQKVSHAAQ